MLFIVLQFRNEVESLHNNKMQLISSVAFNCNINKKQFMESTVQVDYGEDNLAILSPLIKY